MIRSVALSIAQLTTEEMVQSDDGRSLLIRGENARGIWERTLQTTHNGAEAESSFAHPLYTIDKELVQAESWWEDNGRIHHSWMRGATKYGGGDFESKRYIDEDDVYVCETTFHPTKPNAKKAKLTWRYERA